MWAAHRGLLLFPLIARCDSQDELWAEFELKPRIRDEAIVSSVLVRVRVKHILSLAVAEGPVLIWQSADTGYQLRN